MYRPFCSCSSCDGRRTERLYLGDRKSTQRNGYVPKIDVVPEITMRNRIAAVVLVLCSATGVAQGTGPQRVQLGERSYDLGVEAEAFVGEPVVRSKTWAVDLRKANGFTNDIPFTFKFTVGSSVHFPAGTEMRSVGRTNHAGKDYALVQMPPAEFSNNLLMLDENHLFVGYVEARRKVISSGANIFISASPQRIQFTPVVIGLADHRGMSTNREIIYSGKTRDAINLLYREYTEDDLARPAFSQNLVYEPDIPTIRFRDLVIRVISVDGEKIRYVVEKDGLGPQLTQPGAD
jgi:hypothetical protein